MKLADYTFLDNGCRSHPGMFCPQKCGYLFAEAMASRDWRDIFLSEQEYRKNPERRGNNPRPGRNLAEKLETEFIFGDPNFRAEMAKVCGSRWRVLDYKLVMGYPNDWLPEWLQRELGDRPIANLGEYVKPKYRDLTYFRGIDFHQDIIDFPHRAADFITAYLYLDEVGPSDSPLFVMPDSHMLGASEFPHDITPLSCGKYIYAVNGPTYRSTDVEPIMLTGAGGTMFYWHPFILHGTQPQGNATRPRISVRMLIEKNSIADNGCELDKVNRNIAGLKSLDKTQNDIDESGVVVKFGNVVNRI